MIIFTSLSGNTALYFELVRHDIPVWLVSVSHFVDAIIFFFFLGDYKLLEETIGEPRS